jgi:hypothetical protein
MHTLLYLIILLQLLSEFILTLKTLLYEGANRIKALVTDFVT